jgi:hypothetical protein
MSLYTYTHFQLFLICGVHEYFPNEYSPFYFKCRLFVSRLIGESAIVGRFITSPLASSCWTAARVRPCECGYIHEDALPLIPPAYASNLSADEELGDFWSYYHTQA